MSPLLYYYFVKEYKKRRKTNDFISLVIHLRWKTTPQIWILKRSTQRSFHSWLPYRIWLNYVLTFWRIFQISISIDKCNRAIKIDDSVLESLTVLLNKKPNLESLYLNLSFALFVAPCLMTLGSVLTSRMRRSSVLLIIYQRSSRVMCGAEQLFTNWKSDETLLGSQGW